MVYWRLYIDYFTLFSLKFLFKQSEKFFIYIHRVFEIDKQCIGKNLSQNDNILLNNFVQYYNLDIK